MSVRSVGASIAPQKKELELLGAGVLTASSQFVSFGPIPQTHRNLRIIVTNLKGASASTTSYIQMFINSAYTNFSSQDLTLDNNSYYPYVSSSNLFLPGGRQTLSLTTSTSSAALDIRIFNYSSTTTPKQGVYSIVGQSQATANQVLSTYGSFNWINNTQVLSWGIYAVNSFQAGARLEIYGEGAI